jgi:hypothetical protein
MIISALRRRQPAAQQRRRAEVQHRDLEEDDPEDQHVDAVGGEHLVEGVGLEPVDRRPAREHHADGENAADEQEHHRRDGVGEHQLLGIGFELQPRTGAGPVGGRAGHGRLPAHLT